MDLSEAAQELYAAPFEDFLSVRTARVKAARATGDKELAKQVGALRKPTRSAWLVNLLARAAPQDVEELLGFGTVLRDAQANRDGAELRRLSTARHRAVEALSRRAVDLGAAAGYTATDAIRQEVAQTLSAALADPEQAQSVRTGTLSAVVTYGGFGPFGPAPEPVDDSRPEPVEGPADDLVRELATAWRQAQEDLAGAEEEAERATAEADALADQVDDLRAQLEAAEQAEREAQRRARAARKRIDELSRAERAARAAAEDAGAPLL